MSDLPPNVHRLQQVTKLPLDPDLLLRSAVGKLKSVVIIGYRKDGSEYFTSSDPDGGNAVWLMERCKHKLMKLVDDATA